MPESLLNYRFRGTTLPYEELLVPLEKNIIIDKVTTPFAIQGEENRHERATGDRHGRRMRSKKGHGKTSELAVQVVFKGTGAEVDGTEERVPAGVYRNTLKKERSVLEGTVVQDRS